VRSDDIDIHAPLREDVDRDVPDGWGLGLEYPLDVAVEAAERAAWTVRMLWRRMSEAKQETWLIHALGDERIRLALKHALAMAEEVAEVHAQDEELGAARAEANGDEELTKYHRRVARELRGEEE